MSVSMEFQGVPLGAYVVRVCQVGGREWVAAALQVGPRLDSMQPSNGAYQLGVMEAGTSGTKQRGGNNNNAAAADAKLDMQLSDVVDQDGSPLFGVYLLAREGVTPRKGVKEWETLGMAAMAIVDSNSRERVTLSDPSNWYTDVCTATFVFRDVPSHRGTGSLEREIAKATAERAAHIQSIERWNREGRARWPAARNIFLRQFRSVTGEFPASYFCMLGARDPIDTRTLGDVAAQMLENAATHYGWGVRAVLDRIAAFRYRGESEQLATVLGIVGEMLVMPAAANFYHGDHARDGTVVDRFQLSTFHELGQGDCEDVAKDVHYFATQLQRLRHNELRDLVWLLQQYVFVMVTGLATTPKLQRPNADDRGENPKDYICHVWAAGIPRRAMVQWLRAGADDGGSAMDELVRIGALTLEGTNFTTAMQRALPVYYPDGRGEVIAQSKWYLAAAREGMPPALQALGYSLPSPATMRTPTTPGEQSRFYRYVNSVWMHPMSPGGPIDLTFFSASGKHGITFQEFLELKTEGGTRLVAAFERQNSDDEVLRVLEQEMPRRPLVARQAGIMLNIGDGRSRDWLPDQKDHPDTPPFIVYRAQHDEELTDGVRAAIAELGGFVVTMPITDVTRNISIFIPMPNEVDEDVAAGVRQKMP